jgi:hypothetical protein
MPHDNPRTRLVRECQEPMAFGYEFSERLTHLVTATVICGATATLAPGLGVLALVEALHAQLHMW